MNNKQFQYRNRKFHDKRFQKMVTKMMKKFVSGHSDKNDSGRDIKAKRKNELGRAWTFLPAYT